MLVLTRKVGQRILIGENVAITVVRVSQGTVRLGIEAPRKRRSSAKSFSCKWKPAHNRLSTRPLRPRCFVD